MLVFSLKVEVFETEMQADNEEIAQLPLSEAAALPAQPAHLPVRARESQSEGAACACA